ncbi:MAG: M56 family metallopeptidase, partial [Candidatus Acidiferrum sp.]
MMLLISWLSPLTLRLLALSLLHFLWQGGALAALAYLAMALCRTASARYVAGVTTLALMLAAPVATFLLLRSQEQAPQAAASIEVASPSVPSAAVTVLRSHKNAPVQPAGSPPYFPWLVELWAAGVVLLSLRSAGGIVLVERLRRKETIPVTEELLKTCLTLQSRMGLTRVIRYCESLRLDAPAVAGWIRPIVLLPIGALTGLTESQLEAVIAHELAHIQRYDAFANLFQVGVETLLFYHPAVWWLGKRVRTEREHCCDDAAVALCGNAATYAYALTRLAESKAAPQLVMAANRSPLVARIARLLGANATPESFRGANLSAGVLCLSAALLAGSALLGSVHYVHAQTPAAAPSIAARPAEPATVSARPSAPAPAAAPEPYLAPTVAAAPVPQANPEPTKQSYIDSLKESGLTDLTVDELIGLKVQGITADYIKSMKPYIKSKDGKLDVDTLIGLKVQGVTGDYVKNMRAATGEDLDADELIGLKVQGVTPEYLQQMRDLGLKNDADDIIGMKVQGVTADYVQHMRELGLKVDSGDIIGMKVQGVTPEYVRQMHALGLKIDAGEIIGMKVQGVSPEYVKGFNDLGLHPSTDELIGMKVQGVTPEYFKEMQAAGFKMDVDEAIGAKIQGVTQEFIAKVRSHG